MSAAPTWSDLIGRDLLDLATWDAPPEDSGRRLDRVLELHEYAEAGVPWYLLVEPGPPVVLTEFSLVGGADTRVAEHRGTAALGLGATVDLDALG